MKDRFLYNSQRESINDSLQGIDLLNDEICTLLNGFCKDNFDLESDNRYYMALYDMYERNYLDLKKGVEVLIRKYSDLAISDEDNSLVFNGFVEDLEGLFKIK